MIAFTLGFELDKKMEVPFSTFLRNQLPDGLRAIPRTSNDLPNGRIRLIVDLKSSTGTLSGEQLDYISTAMRRFIAVIVSIECDT